MFFIITIHEAWISLALLRIIALLEFFESGTDGAECSRKVASARRVAGAKRFIVNARDLQFDCARVLHETLLVPVLINGSEIMLRKEKKRSRIRVV